MLQVILALNVGKEKCKEEKLERDRQRNRSIYFYISYSKLWKEPIHKILKKLRNTFNLKWLRLLMPYLPPLPQHERDAPQGDLSKKLTKSVELMDFKVRDWNCRGGRGPDKCQYGGVLSSFTELPP
jgi:hypothetical protein